MVGLKFKPIECVCNLPIQKGKKKKNKNKKRRCMLRFSLLRIDQIIPSNLLMADGVQWVGGFIDLSLDQLIVQVFIFLKYFLFSCSASVLLSYSCFSFFKDERCVMCPQMAIGSCLSDNPFPCMSNVEGRG